MSVVLGKLFNLSEFHFPQLQDEIIIPIIVTRILVKAETEDRRIHTPHHRTRSYMKGWF